jgi:hypothetical protein
MTITVFELALIVFISNIGATMVCEGIETLVEAYEDYKKKKKNLTEQKD